MEEELDQLVFSFNFGRLMDPTIFRAFIQVMQEENALCPVTVLAGETTVTMAYIKRAILYRGSEDDLSDSLITLYAQVNDNFRKNFRVKEGNKEGASLRFNIHPSGNVITSASIADWHDYFESRTKRFL